MYKPVVKASNTPVVRVIPATKSFDDSLYATPRINVCAYGRVSTDHEEQQTSFEAQRCYYTDKITQNDEWIFAGFYSDEGITGRSTKNRTGFKSMIEDCKAGKIDLILTKSISRFSRNTLDSIAYVRMLRRLGIGVIFEKENINTLESSSELLFTVLSALAQEEITSMSKNIAFGHRERARQGKVTYHYDNWYAYKKGADGKPDIVPEEAKIVEEIFAMYLSGDTLKCIASALNERNIKAPKKKRWTGSVVKRIIENEKYCGNVLFQKTITLDPISGVRVKNNGQRPKYLAQNAHDAIITEATYNLAQLEAAKRKDSKIEIFDERKRSKYSGLYALTDRMVCGHCQTGYKRKVWKNRDGSNRYVWVCMGRSNKAKEKRCQLSPTLDEYRIHEAIVGALNHYLSAGDIVKPMIEESFQAVLENSDEKTKIAILKQQVLRLQKSFSELVEISAKSQNPDMFNNQFKALSDEILEKRTVISNLTRTEEADNVQVQKRLEKVSKTLQMMPALLEKYDDKIVRQTVEKIVVVDEDHLKITFVNGEEKQVRMKER